MENVHWRRDALILLDRAIPKGMEQLHHGVLSRWESKMAPLFQTEAAIQILLTYYSLA